MFFGYYGRMDEEHIIESYSKEEIDNLIAASEDNHYGLPEVAVKDAEGYEQTYAIARTDEERQNASLQSYEEMLWAFNAEFMEEATGLPAEVFKKLAELSENANEAVRAIVDSTCGFEKLVQDAVDADGYGNNLAFYDGEEVELECGYYAYRMD